MKLKVHIVVQQATHFLRWELPIFAQYFELVDQPDDGTIVLAFGPDVIEKAKSMPALRRVVMLFPGFGFNPYHDLTYRRQILDTIDEYYDLVFVNPGPLVEAYGCNSKVVVCPFSIDTELVNFKKFRTQLNSLLHVSADYPQKDWKRSEEIMKLTGLRHEVYPPRGPQPLAPLPIRAARRIAYAVDVRSQKAKAAHKTPPRGYVDHSSVIRKYQKYDGFVHVAADVAHPKYLDGKYTAALMEAGLTGAILFWHDTLGLGNNLETVFDLPVEPEKAAQRILDIRKNIDVKQHSRLTREEILDSFSPQKSVGFRCLTIKGMLS